MKRLSAILTLIFVSVTFLSINSSATTINVPNDYETIQEAINHSAHGNTVLVAPGTYVENINFLGRNIVVMGNPDNPNEVIIDGNNNGSVVSFCNGETDQALLTGFTIRNGSGTNGHNGHPYGGGVYVRGCSPTVSHCHINNNRAVFGAGIGAELSGGDPTISHCYISNNIAGMGGGVVIDRFSNGTI